jgi:type II secretory pathway component GspD/PulD (secretin)
MIPRRLVLIPLLAVLAVPAAADETRVIQLKHRPAEELVPAIRPLLRPGDAISGTDYRLLIRTSDKNLKEIERVLAQLDVARRNLTLSVRQVAAADADRILHELKGEKKVGDQIRIKLPRNTPDDDSRNGRGRAASGTSADEGLTVGGDSPDSLRYRTRRRQEARVDDLTQVLRVQDGGRAFVRVGQAVPHLTTVRRYSGTAPTVSQAVEFQDVTTGFEVRPRLAGEHVQLEIAPRLMRLEDRATGLASVQQAWTTVTVKPGEWLDLGQVLGRGDDNVRAIFESADSSAGERRTILLKVE